MVKNLVVTHIPKDPNCLQRVLFSLGDYSWTTESYKTFLEITKTHCIWYNSKYDSYFPGNSFPYNKDLIHKTYNKVING